ncbi:MAG: M43 family zinc metalloprotease [Bacteroidota bacterium]
MRLLTAFSLLVLLSIWACSPKLSNSADSSLQPTAAPIPSQHFAQAEDVQVLPAEYDYPNQKNLFCKDPTAFAPDTNYVEHTPIKYIRVNFHWMNTTDRKANLDGKKAVDFVKGMVKASNYHLRKNKKMWLPVGNDIPALPTQFRIVLTPRPDDPTDDGIYFHYDDEKTYYVHKGKTRNLFKRDLINEYGVQLDTVLNVFLMPHHPDSVASKKYLAGNVGVALRNTVKIAGIVANGGTYWDYAPTLNHEIGHILGLAHAWRSDGCDDTPRHKNDCYSQSIPGCATRTSNNVMDYSNAQKAWTPCQIGKIHMRLSRPGNLLRNFLEPRWCTLNEEASIVIRDTVSWDCRKDLEGHLIIENGGYLSMYCSTSIPKGGRIIVKPGGTLLLQEATLMNTCGEEWDGIVVEEMGGVQGQIILKGAVKIENAVHTPDLTLND